jgi:hypothetical protein
MYLSLMCAIEVDSRETNQYHLYETAKENIFFEWSYYLAPLPPGYRVMVHRAQQLTSIERAKYTDHYVERAISLNVTHMVLNTYVPSSESDCYSFPDR